MILTDLIKKKLVEFDPSITGVFISPKQIDFEERFRLLCFHCKHYNINFTCPPKIPAVDYKNIITNEYKNGMLVFGKMEFNESNYSEIRTLSTIKIHKALLFLESVLFGENIAAPLSFIGGSCKLCKSGCPPDKCNNPYHARIPMEAAGINVVSTAQKAGVEIVFPVRSHIIRCGLILW